jgi:hypothetical protein
MSQQQGYWSNDIVLISTVSSFLFNILILYSNVWVVTLERVWVQFLGGPVSNLLVILQVVTLWGLGRELQLLLEEGYEDCEVHLANYPSLKSWNVRCKSSTFIIISLKRRQLFTSFVLILKGSPFSMSYVKLVADEELENISQHPTSEEIFLEFGGALSDISALSLSFMLSVS